MKRSGGGAGTAPVRLNAALGGIPGHCVSITHVPFLGHRAEGYGLSDRQLTDASDRAAGVTLIQIFLARTRPLFATILLPFVDAVQLRVFCR